jgi:hypothetical protein
MRNNGDDEIIIYLTPYVPLSWQGVPQERGIKRKRGDAPLKHPRILRAKQLMMRGRQGGKR